MNYLGTFVPTTEVCEQLWMLTSTKCKWTWKGMCQGLCERAKHQQKEFNHGILQRKTTPVPRERCISSQSRRGLLHARDELKFPRHKIPDNEMQWAIAFTSKSLTNTETCYSKVLCLLHGLETFHHYCFACELYLQITSC